MQATSLIVGLWFFAIAAFVALMVYRGHLTQHETDELFLDDAADDSFRKQEHDDIVRRVNLIQPFCQGTGGAAAVLTVVIMAGAIVQNWSSIHF